MDAPPRPLWRPLLSLCVSAIHHLSPSAPPLCSAHSSLSPGLPPSLALVRELSLFCAFRYVSLSHTSSEVQRSLARGSLSGDIDRFHSLTLSQSLPLSFHSLRLSLSPLSCSPASCPPACTQCRGGTSGGSRACVRAALMCAKCCRTHGGCGRHVVDGAAPSQQQQQPAPQQLPQPPVAPLPQIPAQPPPDLAAAAPALSQLTALLQQLTALLPALAAAAPAQHPLPPAPQAAFPSQPAVAALA